jgi:hypothetical protein
MLFPSTTKTANRGCRPSFCDPRGFALLRVRNENHRTDWPHAKPRSHKGEKPFDHGCAYMADRFHHRGTEGTKTGTLLLCGLSVFMVKTRWSKTSRPRDNGSRATPSQRYLRPAVFPAAEAEASSATASVMPSWTNRRRKTSSWTGSACTAAARRRVRSRMPS